MTKKERLRRVVILCAQFARNLAYYRAGHGRVTKKSPEFWITIDGNFVETAVLDWCKLFADRNGNHCWARVVADAAGFEAGLRSHLGISSAEFAGYVTAMRTHRNKFGAHLDDLPAMDIPFLDRAKAAVEFYHGHVVRIEASRGDLDWLPTDLVSYYDQCFDEAQRIYASAGL